MNGDGRQSPVPTTASLLLGSLEFLQKELGAIGDELITLLRSAGITPTLNEDEGGRHSGSEINRPN